MKDLNRQIVVNAMVVHQAYLVALDDLDAFAKVSSSHRLVVLDLESVSSLVQFRINGARTSEEMKTAYEQLLTFRQTSADLIEEFLVKEPERWRLQALLAYLKELNKSLEDALAKLEGR